MYDAQGNRSEDVYYEIEQESKDNYIFTITASSDWINQESTILPVVIDPQITTTEKSLIEYEKYYINKLVAGEKIKRLSDNLGKQVILSYNSDNLLDSIIDAKGRRIKYTYNSITEELVSITYDIGQTITFEYNDEYISLIENDKLGLRASLTYSNNRLIKIKNYSLISLLSKTTTIYNTNLINEININYYPINELPVQYVTIEEDNVKERYYFNSLGSKIEYRLEQNSKVVEAQKYEYTPYWIGDVKQDNPMYKVTFTTKDSLNINNIDDFIFVDDYCITDEINAYNQSDKKTISKKKISDNLYITSETNYLYDSKNLLQQQTNITKYFNLNDLEQHSITNISLYTYNTYGNLIKSESYVVGEELTKGKNICEKIYDEFGNLISECSYNSLDTSSKYYKEYKYNENNSISTEFNELGNSEVNITYYHNTNLIKEYKMPNNSVIACGYDNDNNLSSITLSDEDLEENSNQKIYKNGQVVELNCQTTNVLYTYDYKRRITKVDIDNVNYINNTYIETDDNNIVKTVYNTLDTTLEVMNYYDKNNNFLSKKINNQNVLIYTYNSKGQVEIVDDIPSGISTNYCRDNYDNITTVEHDYNGDMVRENYLYDNYGMLKEIELSGIVSHKYVLNYNNDSDKTLNNITFNNIYSIYPKYDKLNRITNKIIQNNNTIISNEKITYLKFKDHTTNIPSKISYVGTTDNIKYTYDNMGNIIKVSENGVLSIRYKYDLLNRLIREDNKVLNKTVLFTYDNNGNILNKRVLPFTLKTDIELEELETIDYEYIYENDKLISYDNKSFLYNKLGVPTNYNNNIIEWSNIYQLSKYKNTTFGYDFLGRRISKNQILYYYDSNNKLIKQSNGLEFIYNYNTLIGFIYNQNTYFYRRNIQNDITAIIDTSGNIIVKYVYDAWGNHKIFNNLDEDITNLTSGIGYLNPFRYRGYYYDVETQLFYCNSRYYSPELCRWISPDSIEYLDPNSINGLNLYCYCGNNPVMGYDPNGTFDWNNFWKTALGVTAAVGLAALAIGATIVSGGSFGLLAAGFAMGAAASFVGQGIGNVLSGENFFNDFSLSSIIMGGIAGAAFITGVGGLLGAVTIGAVSNAGTSALENKSWANIVASAIVGGVAAGIGFGVGRFVSNHVFKNSGMTFMDYFELGIIDTNAFFAAGHAFAASWYTFLPSLATSASRGVIKALGNKGIGWF